MTVAIIKINQIPYRPKEFLFYFNRRNGQPQLFFYIRYNFHYSEVFIQLQPWINVKKWQIFFNINVFFFV